MTPTVCDALLTVLTKNSLITAELCEVRTRAGEQLDHQFIPSLAGKFIPMAVNCSPLSLARTQATDQRCKAESPNPQTTRSLTFLGNETSPSPAVAARCRERRGFTARSARP